MPTNSAPIRINKKVEFKKARTRNNTELTGFLEKITNIQVVTRNAENKKKEPTRNIICI
tara:strand:+ start:1105 stop:1281 length:177 start_codon:yes stop_codon:yes gene_type:complete